MSETPLANRLLVRWHVVQLAYHTPFSRKLAESAEIPREVDLLDRATHRRAVEPTAERVLESQASLFS